MTVRGINIAPPDVIVNALRCKEHYEKLWDGTPIKPPVIDNVAVLFSDAEAENAFINYAERVGWRSFNVQQDHVIGHLSREAYDVRFSFLRDPDDPNFRIESMLLDPEESAIHAHLLRNYGEGCVAQGSYKPTSGTLLDDYQMENAFLHENGFNLVECFQARYGLYTYFRAWSDGDDLSFGYLKVRINLRDEQ